MENAAAGLLPRLHMANVERIVHFIARFGFGGCGFREGGERESGNESVVVPRVVRCLYQ